MDLEQLYSKVLKDGKELAVDMCIVLAVCIIMYWAFYFTGRYDLSIWDMFTFIYATRALYNAVYVVVRIINNKIK